MELTPPRIRSALFVDFDNIYITLESMDPRAAEVFATRPRRWLDWLQATAVSADCFTPGCKRRILIRRCYLNPNTFHRFRPHFTSAGFEVIDCPPLTQQGKTTADIHMVLHMLDALNDDTRLDEFIIMSGDADFTPVLRRIRREDRFSSVLSAGITAAAYRSSCDYFIPQDDFVSIALGMDREYTPPSVEPNQLNAVREGQLDRLAAKLVSEINQRGLVQADELARIYVQCPFFTSSSDWLGFGTLRRLTQTIVQRNPSLIIVEDDPWVVELAHRDRNSSHFPHSADPRTNLADTAGLRSLIRDDVIQIVAESSAPVTLAVVAQELVRRYPDRGLQNGWLGVGSFKSMLTMIGLGELSLSSVIPGYVFDPRRQTPPEQAKARRWEKEMQQAYPDFAELVIRYCEVTDMPLLLPEHYATLLQTLAVEINDNGFQITQTSKAVRDRCVEHGAPVARSHVNFVLSGIGRTGHFLGGQTEYPLILGEALVRNMEDLLTTARVDLDDQERDAIRQWLLSGLDEDSA